MATVRLKAAGDADPVDVRIERVAGGGGTSYVVHVGDRVTEADVEFVGENRGWLRIHGEVVPFFATAGDDEVRVWMRGREYCFEAVRRTARRAGGGAAAAAGADVIAPMPGTVLRIDVAVGDVVEVGQAAAVMESMKMEMTLTVPRAGRVRSIGCEVGALVEMGAVLVSVEGTE